LDGPAIEWADGYTEWYVDGKLHKLDGPAVDLANGYKAWWVDGNRHRMNGPAIEYADGTKYWYMSGNKVSKTNIDNLRLKTLTISFVVNRRIWKKTL
jgi:hypothetical protein